MISSLESKQDIAQAQGEFENAFKLYVEDSYFVDIGYQGGHANRRVIWMPSLDLWAHFGDPPSEKGPPNRYWNVFGIGRPSGMVSIICEINPPKEARNNPPAGVFARDDRNNLLILHRGRLTVTGGIKTEFVKRHINSDWIAILDCGRKKKAILVAKIPSDTFGKDLRHFVLEIERVKELARARNLGFA
jgi:hypothetical protein